VYLCEPHCFIRRQIVCTLQFWSISRLHPMNRTRRLPPEIILRIICDLLRTLCGSVVTGVGSYVGNCIGSCLPQISERREIFLQNTKFKGIKSHTKLKFCAYLSYLFCQKFAVVCRKIANFSP